MSSAHPLRGYVVVELGHSVAAPYTGLILAEMGAEVIKVENPDGGDAARGWGPPFVNGAGPHFSAFNRNKASLAVNLADAAQRDALVELILARADAVVCNLRAGAAAKLGVDADRLRALKPALVYCDLGAFGSGGPLSHKPGYDPLMQAYCGVMSVTGESAERPPVRVGVSMVDMGAGMWSAIGILAALLERKDTGVGGHVETSLFETALAWVATPMARHAMGGGPQKPQGSGAAGIVPYQAFRTRTGWLVIGAGNDRLFAQLCRVMGRPDLAEDPRYLRNGDRVVNQKTLLPAIEAYAGQYDSDTLSGILDQAGIPNAPVQTIAQLAEDEHARQLGMIQEKDGQQTVGLPIRFDGQRPPLRTASPLLGEANDRLLGDKYDARCG